MAFIVLGLATALIVSRIYAIPEAFPVRISYLPVLVEAFLIIKY